MEQQIDPKEQKFLKAVDKTDRKIKRANYLIFTVIYCVIILVALGMTAYYGICRLNGTDEENRFFTYLLYSGVLILIFLVYKLLDKAADRFINKESHFDPAAVQLPAAGTVTLETALHKMAPKNGVIIWDTIWGILTGFFLLIAICLPGGKTGLILGICAVLAVILFVGHLLFYGHWKKHTFTDSLLKNTKKYIRMEEPSLYAKAIEEGLKKNILLYEKKLVLTEDHIIGITGSDTGFIPVALPMTGISQISFYDKQVVSTRYSYTQGILKCQTKDGKQVSFLIGRGVQINRMLEALNHCNVPFKKEETIYQ